MKLVAPKLSYIEKTSFEECLKKMKFQDVHIDQNIQQRTIIQDLTFDGCLFENIDFTKVSLKHLDLIDVTFDKCDLSNQNFDHQYLNRVQFKNCKLTGTSFIETNLKDVLFDHCQVIVIYHQVNCSMLCLIIVIYKKHHFMMQTLKKYNLMKQI